MMFQALGEKSNAVLTNPESAGHILSPDDQHIAQSYPDFQQRMRTSGHWLRIADAAALFIAFFVAAGVASAWRQLIEGEPFQDLFSLVSLRHAAVYTTFGLTAILWLDSRGHYRQRLPYWEKVGHIVAVTLIGLVASGFAEFVTQGQGSRLWIATSWVLFGILVFFGRIIVRRWLAAKGRWAIPSIIIGEGPSAAAAERALARDHTIGFNIVEKLPSSVLSDMKKTRAWKQILMMHDASHIFIALEGSELERYQSALKSLPRARVPCTIVPPWLGLPSSTLTPHNFMMQDVLMLHDTNRLTLPMSRLIKRAVDIILASLALIGLSPVMLTVALLVRRDGGPALFSQDRVGRHSRLFQCYKFRSMRVDAEEFLKQFLEENTDAAAEWAQYQKLKNDVRITKVGDLIRRTSIDELPQLFNVLKGDMSLVGPRPCMPGQEKLYAEDFSFYESVRPGITGPWQVSGRNQLTFKERVNLEAWYARNWSLWLDIVIILKTVPTLLKRGQAF